MLALAAQKRLSEDPTHCRTDKKTSALHRKSSDSSAATSPARFAHGELSPRPVGSGPDRNLPGVVKVRHGRNAQGKLLHYYLNFSGEEQTFSYPYGNGSDLLTNASVRQGQAFNLKPWDL